MFYSHYCIVQQFLLVLSIFNIVNFMGKKNIFEMLFVAVKEIQLKYANWWASILSGKQFFVRKPMTFLHTNSVNLNSHRLELFGEKIERICSRECLHINEIFFSPSDTRNHIKSRKLSGIENVIERRSMNVKGYFFIFSLQSIFLWWVFFFKFRRLHFFQT